MLLNYSQSLNSKPVSVRDLCLVFLSIFLCSPAAGQSNKDKIWQNYSTEQKRLLVTATAQFLYTVSQGQFDKDSSILYSCHTYGAGRLFPYKDGFVSEWTSPGTQLIEAGAIAQATQMTGKLKAEEKIRLLLDLGIYYLFKTGAVPSDLDSARLFAVQAIQVSRALDIRWQLESKSLLGKIYFQENKLDEAKNIFAEILKECQLTKDDRKLAIAYENAGKHLPYQDNMKLKNLELSFNSYQALNMKEKQLDVLSEIVVVYFMSDWAMAEKKLYEILELMKEDKYQHSLFTQYVLCYLTTQKGNFIESLSHISDALANMRYTGDTTCSGLFYTVAGGSHHMMGNLDSSVYWYKKAIATRYSQPKLFWYRSLFAIVWPLTDLGAKEEALQLILDIPKEFPPATTFDSMFLAYSVGSCYSNVNNMTLAEKNYSVFLNFADHFPREFTFTELAAAYNKIAWFYFSKGDNIKARLYIQKAFTVAKGRTSVVALSNHYNLLFKLDSIAGDLRSAIEDHVKFKFYDDSAAHISQKLQMDGMTMKYGAEKKDQDIKFLKQQGLAQQSELKQNRLTRNITVGGILLLLVIIALLFNQYLVKQRTNNAINKKNEALNKLVTEKEWLLKEIHHRVKNNLQTVVSLLELQSENLKDEALSAIHESQNRIYAMSLIHQKLYQSDNVASINMATYLQELIGHLREIYNVGPLINIRYDVADLEMDVSQAIPVGLIVNEAVTNCLKYAFNNADKNSEISISLNTGTNNQMQLVVSDNGTGLPTDFTSDNKNGLGFKLMKGLAEDIEGEFTIESGKGTQIGVCFNVSIPFYDTNPVLI